MNLTKSILFFMLTLAFLAFTNNAVAQKKQPTSDNTSGTKTGKGKKNGTGNTGQKGGGKDGNNTGQKGGGKGGSNTEQKNGGKEQKNEGKGKEISEEQIKTAIEKNPDESFKKFVEKFFNQYWKLNPGAASYNGLTQFDTILQIPNNANRQKTLTEYGKLQKILLLFKDAKLNTANKTDYALLNNTLLGAIWYNTVFKSYEWDPSEYNIGESFDRILSNNNLNKAIRLKTLFVKLRNVPAFYNAAKDNITRPTKIHTDLAIQQTEGTLSLFEKSIPEFLESLDSSKVNQQQLNQFKDRLNKATNAIKDYKNWLQNTLKPSLNNPEKTRDFRIGRTNYESKFKFDIQSGYTADEVYRLAVKEKGEIHKKMIEITDKLWEKYLGKTDKPTDKLLAVKQLIDKLSENHISANEFLPEIERQIPKLTEFVQQNNILYMDPSKPLEVRKTPDYMQGVAGASISAPGPFDKDHPTYYNVTPLDGYSKEKAESYLREYNHWILQILNIHEAIPGHYAQLVYSNQSPSLVKSIFGNGSMIEGWACYTERMMLEEGWANNEPEMWLMYYKWNLRIVCNTIIDYGVHVLGMTETDVLKILTQEAFQQQAEADGKWFRVQATQVQLCSYFTGLSEIYALREEEKKRLGKNFNLKTFHEKFLSFGSSPVSEIKKLMK